MTPAEQAYRAAYDVLVGGYRPRSPAERTRALVACWLSLDVDTVSIERARAALSDRLRAEILQLGEG